MHGGRTVSQRRQQIAYIVALAVIGGGLLWAVFGGGRG